MTARTVSVVVNTYNRAESLRRTLSALEQLDHPIFEVVVVSGPSTDDTDAVLREFEGRIKVGTCLERNLAMSRNVGIALAAGELVAFIDDDAYPDPAWLDEIVPAFDEDELAGAGGPTWDYTGAVLQARYSLADRSGHAWVSDGPDPSEIFGTPFGDTFLYPIGTNAVFRRDRLIAIGGFDEEFEYYLDETDVCRRLLDAGWLLRGLDRGEVFHKFLPSDVRTEQRAIRDRFSVLKNRGYFALKHRGTTRTIADAWTSFALFANHHDVDFRWNIEQGLLTEHDLEHFRSEIPRAVDVAEQAFRRGPLNRSAAWFAEREQPFLPFPTRQPVGGKLHLCFVTAEFGPGQLNGIARVVHTLAHELALRGHVVRVFTTGASHDRVDLEDGVWVHRLVPRPGPDDRARDAWPPSWDFGSTVLEALVELDRRRPIDLVQVPNWDSEGLAILRDGRFRVVEGIYTPLATVVAVDDRFDAHDDEMRARLRTERETYSLATAYLACGPGIVEEIEERYGLRLPAERVGFVPHGLPLIEQPPVAEPSEAPDVLFVGRLEPRKGIDTFLAALPGAALRVPDATFTIVGNDTIRTSAGPTHRRQFERGPWGWLAGDRVRFTGLVDDDERTRAYAGCAVFVAPSRYESFGLILLEAMMFAKPVVACDIGGMREIVEHGVTGLLVPPGDASALEMAIVDLLADPERRHAMGQAGRARFLAEYTAGVMADRAEVFYRRVLATTEPRRLPARATPPLPERAPVPTA
jgi:glycogen synthase